MARASHKALVSASMIPCLLGYSLLMGATANAQAGGGSGQALAKRDAASAAAANSNTVPKDANAQNSEGPVRLARVAFVGGSVAWRPAAAIQWADATTNLPLREGAQVWVTDGGRAEIQFDDGSVLRLGNGAVMTLQTLYSDSEGEFTEIKLNAGLATLRLRSAPSVYQLDTPLASIKATGPTEFRLGVDSGLEVAVRLGKVAVEGPQLKLMLKVGDYLDQSDVNAAVAVGHLPQEDSWDLWNDERDELLNEASRPSSLHVPPGIALVAGDLDEYGTWHNDATYGTVWSPRVSEPDWRPYHDGRWTWVAPFGWTWVATEPWGWVPYHYGTWVHLAFGWAWVPGPAQQYWCPAVVHFSEYNGQVAWCPLAPAEVRYPAPIAAGSRAANMASLFSVGQVGVYYVADRTYCVARPFSTANVNHTSGVINTPKPASTGAKTTLNSTERPAVARSSYLTNTGFVPVNAVRAAGGSVARNAAEFGIGSVYGNLPSGNQVYFTAGRAMAPPPFGITPVAGPVAARPTAETITPTHQFVQNVQLESAARRTVFAAPLPAQVQRDRPEIAGADSGSTVVRSGLTNRSGISTLPTNRPTTVAVPAHVIGQSSNGYFLSGSSPQPGLVMPTTPGSVPHTAIGTTPAPSSAPRPAAGSANTGGSSGRTGAPQHQ
jgi:hypothetical protein